MRDKENFIVSYSNAFSKEFCDSLISSFEFAHDNGFTCAREGSSNLTREDASFDTTMIVEGNLKSFPDGSINSFNETLFHHLKEYMVRYPVLDNIGDLHSYSIKVQRTQPSQGYHVWHYGAEGKVARSRVLAFILYLNTIEEGGETEFLYQSKRIKPQQGTLCIFPADFTHLHRGNPPLDETKYIATGWIEI